MLYINGIELSHGAWRSTCQARPSFRQRPLVTETKRPRDPSWLGPTRSLIRSPEPKTCLQLPCPPSANLPANQQLWIYSVWPVVQVEVPTQLIALPAAPNGQDDDDQDCCLPAITCNMPDRQAPVTEAWGLGVLGGRAGLNLKASSVTGQKLASPNQPPLHNVISSPSESRLVIHSLKLGSRFCCKAASLFSIQVPRTDWVPDKQIQHC